MSIRPVEFQGMIQRTNDVGNVKQNEDNQPIVQQQAVSEQETKKIEHQLHKVNDSERKEEGEFRYDAKEKGNGQYEASGGKKKKHGKEPRAKLINQPSGGFDIKI